MQNNKKVDHWVTINGNHVPIYDGETEEDVKNRLDNWNKQNSKKKSYADLLKEKDIYEATAQFIADTHVGVTESVLEQVDHDVLTTVYDTIADIKGKYNCWLKTITLMDRKDEKGNAETAMASISIDGKMRLNPEYFESDWYLDDTYKECVDDNFHPPAPNGAIGVISHELGHAIVYEKLFSRQEELLKGGTDWGFDGDLRNINSWLGDAEGGSSKLPELDTSGGKQLFNEWYKAIQDVHETIATNKDIQIAWSGEKNPKKPSMNTLRLVSQFMPKYDISKYAGTDYHEMIAEAFCDVYCNGNEASLMSKAVYNQFCKEMKK